MGACEAPLPVSPVPDLSPSPNIERTRSHSDLGDSPSAQVCIFVERFDLVSFRVRLS